MSPIAVQKSKLLAKLQEKIPDRQVGLAPADAFFTRKVDLPEGLPWEDQVAFIQLNLESNSPFPMEQLVWGYLQAPGTPWAFVYATPWSRLKRLKFEDPQHYFQLFPGFISLFGQTPEQPTVRFLSQNGVLSTLFYAGGHPVPEKILSRRIEAGLLTDDTQLQAMEKARRFLKADGYAVEDGLWVGEGVSIQSNETIRFRHRHVSEGSSRGFLDNTLSLPERALWAADLRDNVIALKERHVRRRSRLIWKSLHAALWTAAALLLFQLGNFGLAGFNYLRQQKLDEMEPRAERVENKLTLAQRLTQSTEEDLKPFLLMEAINPLRPDSIFFEKVRSQAFNQLEIEGRSAEGVTPVNAFADSINQLEYVAEVQNYSQTRNNQTSFEFTITFSQPPPEPEGGFVIPVEEEDPDGEGEPTE